MCTTTARCEQELGALLTAPADARRFLREAGCSEHATSLLEDAVLLISEVVTNAVRYADAPLVIEVDCDELTLQVRVRDGSPVLPVPQTPDLDSEGGRGMLLLELLAHEWGVEPSEDGKTVWFRLRQQG